MWFLCPEGTEEVLADELRSFGAKRLSCRRARVVCLDEPSPQENGIGGLTVGLRACLASVVASRVLWPIGRFVAADADGLYRGTRALPWHDLLNPGATVAVGVRRTEGTLAHGPYVAQVVKDALCDAMRARTGARPDVDRAAPDCLVQVAIKGGEATVLLDLSGASLSNRRRSPDRGAAPLKETLAAAILHKAHWPARALRGEPLTDPMCGGGTFLLEAALMARGMPPRALWRRFGVDGIAAVPSGLWRDERGAARRQWQAGAERARPAPLFGQDRDPKQVERARAALGAAGLAEDASLRVVDLEGGPPPAELAAAGAGLVVANCPYGERIGGGEVAQVRLLRSLGDWLKQLPGFDAALLLADAEAGFSLGLRAHKVNALYNGPLPVALLQLHVDAGRPPGERAAPPISDFFRRLQKNRRHRGRRAADGRWGAFRVYDADVPEYRAAIDCYVEPDGSEWAYVQPFAAPKSVDPQKARARVRQMLLDVAPALELSPARIVVQQRQRQRGQHAHSAYRRQSERPHFFFIEEDGMRFRVSLNAYVDTGIYLDLRAVRRAIKRAARGCHVLNAFGYTGTMSVAAAMGGAASTTTVDKSATYLDWAAQNFSVNRLSPQNHHLLRADVLEYLRAEGPSFDLIFIGAPTFSAGKWQASKSVFDVGRDHGALCRAAMRRLAPTGSLWFSTHAKAFRWQKELAEEFVVEECSSSYCPPDFAARRPFRLWRLRHR